MATVLFEKEEVDFLETISPTHVPLSIRMIAATALQYDRMWNHWIIEQAFVLSKIHRAILMQLMNRWDEFSGKVGKLSKSLSGLRQAYRVLHQRLMSEI